jgi:hypothetical protein
VFVRFRVGSWIVLGAQASLPAWSGGTNLDLHLLLACGQQAGMPALPLTAERFYGGGLRTGW